MRKRSRKQVVIERLKFRMSEINSMFIPENFIIVRVTPDQLREICKKQNQKVVDVFKLPDGGMISFGEREIVFVIEPKEVKSRDKESSGNISV